MVCRAASGPGTFNNENDLAGGLVACHLLTLACMLSLGWSVYLRMSDRIQYNKPSCYIHVSDQTQQTNRKPGRLGLEMR